MKTVMGGGTGECETTIGIPPIETGCLHRHTVTLLDARIPTLLAAYTPDTTTFALDHRRHKLCALFPHGLTPRVSTITPAHASGAQHAEHINRATAQRVDIVNGVAR